MQREHRSLVTRIRISLIGLLLWRPLRHLAAILLAFTAVLSPDLQGKGVTLSGLPPIVMFTAAPLSIRVGDTTTLTWAVINATSVSIDQEIGGVAPVGRASSCRR